MSSRLIDFDSFTGVQPSAGKQRHWIGGLGCAIGLHAREPDGRDEQTGREYDAEGLLHRVRQGHRRPGDHGAGQDLASRAFHLQPLFPRAGHAQLLRARGTTILRARLSQPVLAQMRVLQRTHTGRKPPTRLSFPRFFFFPFVAVFRDRIFSPLPLPSENTHHQITFVYNHVKGREYDTKVSRHKSLFPTGELAGGWLCNRSNNYTTTTPTLESSELALKHAHDGGLRANNDSVLRGPATAVPCESGSLLRVRAILQWLH